MCRLLAGVGRVGLVDEAEVCGGEVEARCNCAGVVLEEDSGNHGVVDVRWLVIGGAGGGGEGQESGEWRENHFGK